MMRFPHTISAWATKDGIYEFSPEGQDLFPLGVSARYILECERSAALWFRNPDGFERLLSLIENSVQPNLRCKLDDALATLAKEGR